MRSGHRRHMRLKQDENRPNVTVIFSLNQIWLNIAKEKRDRKKYWVTCMLGGDFGVKE